MFVCLWEFVCVGLYLCVCERVYVCVNVCVCVNMFKRVCFGGCVFFVSVSVCVTT